MFRVALRPLFAVVDMCCCIDMLRDKAPTSTCSSRTSILGVEFEAKVPQVYVLVVGALGPPRICNHLVDGDRGQRSIAETNSFHLQRAGVHACVHVRACCICLSVSTCVCMSAHARSLTCARKSLLANLSSHVCASVALMCVNNKIRTKLGTCHVFPNSSHKSQVCYIVHSVHV
jgi:hypothetical protein